MIDFIVIVSLLLKNLAFWAHGNKIRYVSQFPFECIGNVLCTAGCSSIESYRPTFLSLMVWVYFIHIFLAHFFCMSAYRPFTHPRSLNLVPIESAYATSYWSVIVTLALSCTVSEICWQLLCAPDPTPYSTLILGVFPLHQNTDRLCLSQPSRNLEIIFEVQLYSKLCENIAESYRLSGRQTDGRHAVA